MRIFRKSVAKLGQVRGKHFTEWVETVKELKRSGDHRSVFDLCSEIVDAAEAESKSTGFSPPPWWYDQLALAAKRLGDEQAEVTALRRYTSLRSEWQSAEYRAKFERRLLKLGR